MLFKGGAYRERWTDTQRCVQKARGKGSPSRRTDSHQQLAEEGKRLSQRLQRHAACQHTGSVSDTNFKLQAPRMMKGHLASGVGFSCSACSLQVAFFFLRPHSRDPDPLSAVLNLPRARDIYEALLVCLLSCLCFSSLSLCTASSQSPRQPFASGSCFPHLSFWDKVG